MGQDNVHGRDVQDCPVHGHELCNVQDMFRTFYIAKDQNVWEVRLDIILTKSIGIPLGLHPYVLVIV